MQESKIPHLISYFFISLRLVDFSSFFNDSQRPHWPHLFSHSRHSILCFQSTPITLSPSPPWFCSVWMCLVKLCLVAFYSLFFCFLVTKLSSVLPSWLFHSPFSLDDSSLLFLLAFPLIRLFVHPLPPCSLPPFPTFLLSCPISLSPNLLSCSVTVLLFHVVLHPSLSPHLFTRLHLIFSLFQFLPVLCLPSPLISSASSLVDVTFSSLPLFCVFQDDTMTAEKELVDSAVQWIPCCSTTAF